MFFPVMRLKSKFSKVFGTFSGSRLVRSKKSTVELSFFAFRCSKTLATARTSASVILFSCTRVANSSTENPNFIRSLLHAATVSNSVLFIPTIFLAEVELLKGEVTDRLWELFNHRLYRHGGELFRLLRQSILVLTKAVPARPGHI